MANSSNSQNDKGRLVKRGMTKPGGRPDKKVEKTEPKKTAKK